MITKITPRETALEAEIAEQCRLNNMGAEREYVLLGKVTQLERERDALKADAEKWRAYQARKQSAINAGMGKSPLREVMEGKS